MERSNEERRQLLEEVDTGIAEVTEWEADFINSVLSQTYPWTPRQIEYIDRLLDKYLPF